MEKEFLPEREKTSLLSNGLIWFGAAVSIAEIFTGTLLAPLGLAKGLLAILLGHAIGCALMYFAGLIGAKTGKTAMETVKLSFGRKGALFFALLNVLQLLGWTAVMIIGGARAAGTVAAPVAGFRGEAFWCVVIGALIILWLVVGIKNIGKLNLFAMGTLFVLTIVLSGIVFKGGVAGPVSGVMSFGAAVELSAAMPLSWLPLISDYIKYAKRPKAATLVSTSVYFVTSCWMYAIGLGAALFTGESDIARIMLQAGLGIAAVLTVVFSTVTTTYMDAYSAGVSFQTAFPKTGGKWTAVAVCVIGTLLAIFTPIEQYENFLFFIGSVFAPMVAILLTDFFLLKKDHSGESVNIANLVLWAAGFLIYRSFIQVDTVAGSTLPVMIIISILCILVNGGMKHVRRNS